MGKITKSINLIQKPTSNFRTVGEYCFAFRPLRAKNCVLNGVGLCAVWYSGGL